jgi:hypothetical protein
MIVRMVRGGEHWGVDIGVGRVEEQGGLGGMVVERIGGGMRVMCRIDL